MGRMFDVLRQAEVKRDTNPVSSEAAPAEEDFVSDAGNEEVPFIEVGPSRSLEASPAVLAVPSPRLRIASCPEARGVSLARSARPAAQQRFAADLIAFHHPDQPGAAAYHEVAAALLETKPSGTAHVWLCLGTAAGVGTTSVVLNLAISLATTSGLRVVVVDGNLARPAVAERLGLRGRPGLAEVLSGQESLDRAIQPTGVERLTALTAGQFEREPAPGHIADMCRPVLRLLRDRCDVVLIDGGVDAEQLGRACDAVYLVVPQSQVEDAATTQRSGALLHSGAPLRGCIVTGP